MIYRGMLTLVSLLCVVTAALAADPPTVTIPKLARPLVEPAADDPLQADYDKMWEEYEAAISKARDGIAAALEKQVSKATEDGDLDQVEHWDAVKKQFTVDGTLAWDTSPKAAAEWKKANPRTPFPREFNDAVRAAVRGGYMAMEKLEEGYASLVKAYTKAKRVARAKDLREEKLALFTASATRDAPPPPGASDQTPPQLNAKPGHPVAFDLGTEKEIKKHWSVDGNWRLQDGGIRFLDGASMSSLFRLKGEAVTDVEYVGGAYQRIRVKIWGQEFLAGTSFSVGRRGNEVVFTQRGKAPVAVKLKEEEVATLRNTHVTLIFESNSTTPSHIIKGITLTPGAP